MSRYVKLSVSLFTLGWLFLLVNLLIGAADAGIGALRERTNPVSRKYSPDLVESFYPELTPQEVNDLLRVTWKLPSVFVPFYGRKVGPVTSRFVNVSEHGYRLGRQQAPWPPDTERHYVVFFFGGSTAFGFGVQDEETIPSHLQEMLAAVAPRRPALYNFGVPANNSTIERIQFQQILAAGHRPHAAVFLDGLNDLALSHHPPGSPEVAEIIDQQACHRPERLAVRLALQLPAIRLLSKLTYWTGLRRSRQAPQVGEDEGYVDLVVARYRDNQRMVEAIARQFDVLPVFVWQPVPEYGYPSKLYPFAPLDRPEHRQRRAVYGRMARLAVDGALGENFAWCADLGRGATRPHYVDVVHYSGGMSKAVASCIAEHMRDRLALPLGEERPAS